MYVSVLDDERQQIQLWSLNLSSAIYPFMRNVFKLNPDNRI